MKIDSDQAALLKSICAPATTFNEVKGQIWMKATSTEASGQFPAVVDAQAPDRLHLEITNLLGGPEATIVIQDGKYSIRGVSNAQGNSNGEGSWAGIPLRWAVELFLGRTPCPTSAQLEHVATKTGPDGWLEVRVGTENYRYQLKNWGNKPWVEAMEWVSPSGNVKFSFKDPMEPDGAPKRWDAESAKGQVKVRWKNREGLPK